VLERVIENWLDRSIETTYQIPFCYMLSNEGYTIVHITRHCGMEMGKDILAIAPDGTPCAYQLKTGNINLKKWRDEISSQVMDLVLGQIVHPSFDGSKPHRSYLVTNGNIEEEVTRAIDDWNRGFQQKGQSHYKLETIVRGQILEMANDLGTDLWPSELKDINTLLEIFLEDGKGIIPKNKLSSLFETTFTFEVAEDEKEPTKTYCNRVIASASLLCAVSISNFSKENNHVAEIEAWVMYISYLLAFAERWNLQSKTYEKEFNIAQDSIYNSLSNLCDEIKDREHFVEGDPFTDPYFYRIRLTWLVALMSIYALWRMWKRQDGVEMEDTETDDFIRKFCVEKKDKLYLWGEAAISQFLAFFWYHTKINATIESDNYLYTLISLICKQNKRKKENKLESEVKQSHKVNSVYGLASPYYEVNDILPHILGIADEPFIDSFQGSSYTLEGLIHLYVRRNWKQRMKILWPDITRLSYMTFEPENHWDFFRWRVKSGDHKTIMPKHTQEWEELKNMSFESEGECIPQSIKTHPILLLLFLCVYPHRMNSQIFRWLDTKMDAIKRF
jgi:hypothetical protein